jgi:pimeloyl-ACP methyl ester carboxylesterase
MERSIAFGPDDCLIGTLCLPTETARSAGAEVGVILFNAGVLHRIGPHRLNVRLARSLARRGIASIRFDLSGLGDSARPSGEHSFEKQAVVDIQCAMDVLGAQAGIQRFALFGFCSGGCHGYEAAAVDERAAGLLMYDTYIYRNLRSRLNNYRIRIRRRGLATAASSWLRRHVAKFMRRLLAADGSPATPGSASEAGVFRTPTRDEFAKRVRMLLGRGVKVGVIYSGESDDYNYREQFNDVFRGHGITGDVTHDFLPEMDHTVMNLAIQARFIERIVDWTADLDQRLRRVQSNASTP